MEFGPFLKIKLVEEEQHQRLDILQPTSRGALQLARLHLLEGAQFSPDAPGHGWSGWRIDGQSCKRGLKVEVKRPVIVQRARLSRLWVGGGLRVQRPAEAGWLGAAS